jgi:pilus assembly protein Flp/PilA
MKNLIAKIQSNVPAFIKKERGATMVEYAIMVVLIAIVSIAVIAGLGTEVSNVFNTVSGSMNSANTG